MSMVKDSKRQCLLAFTCLEFVEWFDNTIEFKGLLALVKFIEAEKELQGVWYVAHRVIKKNDCV